MSTRKKEAALYQSSASLNVDRLFTHIYCTHRKKMNVCCRPRFIFPLFLLFNMYMRTRCRRIFVTSELHLSLSVCILNEKKKQLTNFSSLLLSPYLSYSYSVYTLIKCSINWSLYSFLVLTQIRYRMIYEKALFHISHAPQHKKLAQNFIKHIQIAYT
jgi:hypothetical protein